MSETGYISAYRIMEEVRHTLNEFSTEYVQGIDTSGAWKNPFITNKINQAGLLITSLLIPRITDYFRKKADLVFSNSSVDLPADFGRLVVLKDTNKRRVYRADPQQLKTGTYSGSSRMYYINGRTIYLDADGINDTYELWYITKYRQIHQGIATAGAAKSITLGVESRVEADYYNGMKIESVTDSWIDTISDYTALRVATLAAETGAAEDVYGIIPEMPEEFHSLIAPLTVLMLKGISVVSKAPVNAAEREQWFDQLRLSLNAFAGSYLDENPEDLFLDLEPTYPSFLGVS
jgi:hypothetical protein